MIRATLGADGGGMNEGALALHLVADAASLAAVMGEISALLLANGDRPLAAKQRFARDVLGLFEKGLGVRMDCAAASAAGEIRVTCEISDELRGLMAAFRAGD